MGRVKEQVQKIKRWGDLLFYLGLLILAFDCFILKNAYVWGIGGFLVSAGFVVSFAARIAEGEVESNAEEGED